MLWVQFPTEIINFSLIDDVHIGSGSMQFPVQIQGIKRQEDELHILLPFSVEFKNAWSYTSILLYVLIA
jgi:hypothetical protein